MTQIISDDLPADYPQRIKNIREISDLTQAQLAEMIGVSVATVNRWENKQTLPNNLSWRRILEIEKSLIATAATSIVPSSQAPKQHYPEFSADPETVWAVAEAHRLSNSHLVNPSFAKEASAIDPLPHQLIAVYQHMLKQSPLRFLLADDAGAGKTIMTGLYIREMLARRLIRRVLIVPPAGLIGNWQREMWNLFSLRFRIITGAGSRQDNPFAGRESDLVIVSLDTLAGGSMFARLRDETTEPYDLVVFDEAHKLSADRLPDGTVRRTRRYRLAEALASNSGQNEDWVLPWSAQHLLLLTATPHMGKVQPYYYLWRLLLPNELSTYEAFVQFPEESRARHFIRRVKEEMVDLDGTPLYSERRCDTLSYELQQGPDSEQELYDETTRYIRLHYNRARVLNSSAARLAMSVFQRRMASSTFALMRSFERRFEKIEGLIEQFESGSSSGAQIAEQQYKLALDLGEDPFETQTADEQFTIRALYEDIESQEEFEDLAMGGGTWTSLEDLQDERDKVRELLEKARRLYERGHESKFEELRKVLSNRNYAGEKFIIFSEHRDTVQFLTGRLEGLGFTGRIASIHGGLDHQAREAQVEFLRKPISEGGANFLVATDAAGEGINLQFCGLMVNYDVPWNPARLEQRLGRIHRYGQRRDEVVMINLVSGSTREGQVLKTLLEKLEMIRKQMGSDKVFDVVGRLFEEVPIREYLEQALDDPDAAASRLDGTLTDDQVRAIQERERALYGKGGDVKQNLGYLIEREEEESYRRLLPGYVRRFLEKAAPVLGVRIDGDMDDAFRFVPAVPGALDPLLPTLETYGPTVRENLTIYRQGDNTEKIWIHPGEPLFDCLSDTVLERFGADALSGAVFTDPHTNTPYLFHIAKITAWSTPRDDLIEEDVGKPSLYDFRLVGLRQTQNGVVEERPIEHLLLLRGVKNFPVGSEPLAALAGSLIPEAGQFATEVLAADMVQSRRREIEQTLPERLDFLRRGSDYQMAELAEARNRCNERVRSGDRSADEELTRIKNLQRHLVKIRDDNLKEIQAEPARLHAGNEDFLIHALVVPTSEPGVADSYEADVEAIAMAVATAYERDLGAEVKDVSLPELAVRAGLPDQWPGFDLLSRRPQGSNGNGQELRIEVKGRRGWDGVELTDNEWAKACNMRGDYWLYVVFDCATPNPRLVRVQDPFGKLLFKTRESMTYTVSREAILAAAES